MRAHRALAPRPPPANAPLATSVNRQHREGSAPRPRICLSKYRNNRRHLLPGCRHMLSKSSTSSQAARQCGGCGGEQGVVVEHHRLTGRRWRYRPCWPRPAMPVALWSDCSPKAILFWFPNKPCTMPADNPRLSRDILGCLYSYPEPLPPRPHPAHPHTPGTAHTLLPTLP